MAKGNCKFCGDALKGNQTVCCSKAECKREKKREHNRDASKVYKSQSPYSHIVRNGSGEYHSEQHISTHSLGYLGD